MLQHERALQVPVAVQARCQPEVPFEKRARLTEHIQNGCGLHMEIVKTGGWRHTGPDKVA
jgi:hypothetical protein